MKVLLSWLREFAPIRGEVAEIADRMLAARMQRPDGPAADLI